MIICVLAQSLESLRVLISENIGILTVQEILDLSIIICNEGWKVGLSEMLRLIEEAFVKYPVIKRIDYIERLVLVKGTLSCDIFKIPKIHALVEWFKNNSKNQKSKRNIEIKLSSIASSKTK